MRDSTRSQKKDMPSDLAVQTPVRLIVADPSENKAHQLDSLLRDAGVPTRLSHYTELADVAHQLDTQGADLLLCPTDLPHLDQLLPTLTESSPELSVLLLEGADATAVTGEWMGRGASDVVTESDSDHLLMVVKRELANICQREHLRSTRRALEEAEQRCQLLLASASAAIAYVHEGMHIYANDGYFQLFGFSDADDMVGLPLMDLLDAASAETLKAELKRFRNGEESASFEFTGSNTDGEELSGTMTLSAAEFEGEHCMQVMVKPAAAAAVAMPVDTDTAPAASGAPAPVNLKSLRDAVETAPADGGTATLMAFRIDDFMPIQREHGIEAAAKLADEVRELAKDSNPHLPVWQVDGYTFVTVVFDGEHADAQEVAETLRSRVESLVLEASERTLTATLTLVLEPVEAGASIGKLADAAIVRLLDAEDVTNEIVARQVVAKSNGDIALGDSSDEVVQLINHAIERQKFLLLYQPIISLRGDADEHYEVYLRMLDSKGNEMAPHSFLQTAIDSGVAGKIDRWVVLQAIKMLSTHRSRGHNTRLTINLTQNSLTDQEFIQWLGVAIKAARLPIDAVIFQVTEADALAHPKETQAFLANLRDMHCQASLSRFGLCNDALSQLKAFPTDFVKLDGSFVQAMESDTDAKDELLNMIRSLQSMGKLTIVPMVESAMVLSTIWQAGANYIQGHYLQEPTTEMDYDFSTEDD